MSLFDGKLNIEVAAASGIEAVVKRELVRLGYTPGGANEGRIVFEGNYLDAMRANMFLRCAERVRVIIDKFSASTFDELFDHMYAIDWQHIISEDGKIVVNAKSRQSALFALSSIQSISKKAIAKKISEKCGASALSESGALYSLEVSLSNDVATVSLDTTGEALHKRGYRTYLGDAPLKETLASAMLQLSVWRPGRPLIDPFCGSGTIPIEAAMMGLNIAPGMNRRFAMQSFKLAPDVRDEVQDEAEQLIKRDAKLKISGFDINPAAIKLAMRHAELAGVRYSVHLQVGDMRDISSKNRYGVIITNPPYGERLMSESEVKELYRDFGKMCRSLDDWCVYVITSFRAFEKYFGKKADKQRKLYNSEIECMFYQYLGSPPPRNAEK